MDSSSTRSDGARRAISVSWRTTLVVLLGLGIVVSVPGCGGCLKQDPLAKKKKEEEEKKKKKEKPKPDFEFGRLHVKPHDPAETRNLVKAGHWMAATQAAKANNFNFKAELDSASTKRGGQPFDVPNTAFRIRMSRPASLPKGQTKHFETIYFIPSLPSEEDGYQGSRMIWLENKMRARRGGREVISRPEPTSTMPHFQYFFLVLSDDPDRYGYLNVRTMDPIAPPLDIDEDGMMDRVLHYRILLPKIQNRVPVPSQPLTWTSIAYVLWDGLDPRLLTPAQQQATLDWLHWGGQIIISGPNSMDLLRGSFMEKYLPALGGDAVSLEASDFKDLDENWSVLNERTNKKALLDVVPEKPPVGVQLTKVAADAEYLDGTGQMVVERRVGGGRIVVTRFPLSDRQIVNWGSFKSFFNGCLLRRPRRTFKLSGQTSLVEAEWTDWSGDTNMMDARATTGLRYFARDVPSADVKDTLPVPDSGQQEVAGWNDRSGAADASRQSLRDAAGISVPEAGFVFRVLAVYLLILAPVNWLVFRVIGRVEWAWVAAPVIAIIGGVAVVRLAQLDIGFARSRTELAVLELQGGYSRGHLARYTALYTSLSTPYDLMFDDESALAMPFPEEVPYVRRAHESVNIVHFRRDKQVSLSGFHVQSNDTGLVHSEQMHNAGGSIDLVGDADKGLMVQNGAELSLKDVGVFGRGMGGQLQLAWIGSLEAGQSVPVDFQPASDGDLFFAQWRDSLTCYSYERQQQDIFRQFDGNSDRALTPNELAQHSQLADGFAKADTDRNGRLDGKEVLQWTIDSREGELTLGRLFGLACQRGGLGKGDVRLVGWTDQDLPGLTIRPGASQKVFRTMVLVHLKRGKLPTARRDTNLLTELEPEPGKIDELDFN